MNRLAWQAPGSDGTPAGSTPIAGGLARVVLTLVIVELTAATAYVHFGLGGALFTLNGIGYVTLAAAYALVTIGAYLVTGSYFALGWITKGIELAIVGALAAEMLIVYGSPRNLWRAVLGSRTVR